MQGNHSLVKKLKRWYESSYWNGWRKEILPQKKEEIEVKKSWRLSPENFKRKKVLKFFSRILSVIISMKHAMNTFLFLLKLLVWFKEKKCDHSRSIPNWLTGEGKNCHPPLSLSPTSLLHERLVFFFNIFLVQSSSKYA